MNAFDVNLKARDVRSAMEWGHVNAARLWLEAELAGLQLAKESEGHAQDLERRLAFVESFWRAVMEVIPMWDRYFCNIIGHGVDEAKQVPFLFEQSSRTAYSETYRTARKALDGRIEVETATHLAKNKLERARKGGQMKKRDSSAGSTAGIAQNHSTILYFSGTSGEDRYGE